jgi:hypothetical protein
MAKNKKVMSLAIDPGLHEQLKDYCERKVVSASSYLGDLIEKGVKIPVDEEPVIYGKSANEQNTLKVILQIPANLRGNKVALAEWLADQSSRLVSKLG